MRPPLPLHKNEWGKFWIHVSLSLSLSLVTFSVYTDSHFHVRSSPPLSLSLSLLYKVERRSLVFFCLSCDNCRSPFDLQFPLPCCRQRSRQAECLAFLAVAFDAVFLQPQCSSIAGTRPSSLTAPKLARLKTLAHYKKKFLKGHSTLLLPSLARLGGQSRG